MPYRNTRSINLIRLFCSSSIVISGTISPLFSKCGWVIGVGCPNVIPTVCSNFDFNAGNVAFREICMFCVDLPGIVDEH